MAISDEAKSITERIYDQYGTDTGILMGIPSSCVKSVQSVVQSTIDILDEQGQFKPKEVPVTKDYKLSLDIRVRAVDEDAVEEFMRIVRDRVGLCEGVMDADYEGIEELELQTKD